MKDEVYSTAMPVALHKEAIEHLLRSDGQEDLCFGLWFPSKGKTRTTALLSRLILPEKGNRRVHGNASFLPRYFERALGEAIIANAGLAFLHSHPGPGWQDMSADDCKAERTHAAATFGATSLPLVGMTLGTNGAWSARFWVKIAPRTYERWWCVNTRVVGDPFSVTYADHLLPRPGLKEELMRTVSAWGEDSQANLARLRVGIVGAGSVGAIIGEALARTGIAHIKLIDFDRVEFVNLDRLLHATKKDALAQRLKVVSLGLALQESATADDFFADRIDKSIAEEDGFRAALDCDVLFSCVDRPWARSVLNFIAYAHLIPVVDGGIKIEVTKQRTLHRADWKAHIAMPGRRCLECLQQYDPSLVQMERDGLLDDPSYIAGLPLDHQLRRNENVFAFSLGVASFEILQFLMMVIAPLGISNPGEQAYHFVPGLLDEPKFLSCNEKCPYPALIAKGDRTGFVVTAHHKQAEKSRSLQNAARERILWRYRFAEYLHELVDHPLRISIEERRK